MTSNFSEIPKFDPTNNRDSQEIVRKKEKKTELNLPADTKNMGSNELIGKRVIETLDKQRERSNAEKDFHIEQIGNAIRITEAGETKEYKLEAVEGRNDPNLKAAYDLMERTFNPEDLDSFKACQDKVEGQRCGVPVDVTTKFFLVKDGDKVVSSFSGGLYELEDRNGKPTGEMFFLIEYAVTQEDKRKYGLGRETYKMAVDYASKEADRQGKKLLGTTGECTWTSEQFWNKNGLERVYNRDEKGSYKEIEYVQAPLGYDTATGEMDPDCGSAPEHLMVHFFNEDEKDNPANGQRLVSIVNAFNRSSSYLPKEAFTGNQEQWERHVKEVRKYEDDYEKQLPTSPDNLQFMTRETRQKLMSGGIEVYSQLTNEQERNAAEVKKQIGSDTL